MERKNYGVQHEQTPISPGSGMSNLSAFQTSEFTPSEKKQMQKKQDQPYKKRRDTKGDRKGNRDPSPSDKKRRYMKGDMKGDRKGNRDPSSEQSD